MSTETVSFCPLSQIQLINPSNYTQLLANILSTYLSTNASELQLPNVPTPHSPSLGQNALHQPGDTDFPFKLCRHPKPWLGLTIPPDHEELSPSTEQLILRGVLMNYGLIGMNLLTKSTGRDVKLHGQLQASAREAGSRHCKAQSCPVSATPSRHRQSTLINAQPMADQRIPSFYSSRTSPSSSVRFCLRRHCSISSKISDRLLTLHKCDADCIRQWACPDTSMHWPWQPEPSSMPAPSAVATPVTCTTGSKKEALYPLKNPLLACSKPLSSTHYSIMSF